MVFFRLWVNPTKRVSDRHEWDNDRARKAIIQSINDKGIDWRVVFVSATGFLTDSYALFATNIILPSLAYIYWPDSTNGHNQLAINCVTLAGSVCGQALFGYLADRYGRRKLYGIELVIVIFGTLGMAQVSTGTNKSMSIILWIVFWRFFMGLGIGAEYPLSAVITAEFASTKYRSIMMAMVFLMQPFGQFCAATVGWSVLTGLVKSRGLENLPLRGADLTDQQKFVILSTIDTVWRCVVAVGTFPAVIAIVWRLSIPESPRYTLDVLNDGLGAFYDIREHHDLNTTDSNVTSLIGIEQIVQPIPMDGPPPDGPPPDGLTAVGPTQNGHPSGNTAAYPSPPALVGGNPAASPNTPRNSPPNQQTITVSQSWRSKPPNYFTFGHLFVYFIEEKNWRSLAATSGCWFLLDFAFYGLAIDNPRRIAAIWAGSYPDSADFRSTDQNWPSDFIVGNNTTVYSNAEIPDWENPFHTTTNIYNELYGNAFRYVITITIGSLIGSLVMIMVINKLPRKQWLILSFLLLALLFVIMGAAMKAWMFTTSHPWAIAFYISCQFLFNLGPNTLTFIIPAEIFPTRYRCFCHGISAAAGKLGSLTVQGLLSRHEFTTDPTHFRIVLGCFSIPMILGAVLAWAWLPQLQEDSIPSTRTCIPPTFPNKSLETLAAGRPLATSTDALYPPDHRLAGLPSEGQVLTFRGKFAQIRKRLDRRGGVLGRKAAEAEAARSEQQQQGHEMHAYPNRRTQATSIRPSIYTGHAVQGAGLRPQIYPNQGADGADIYQDPDDGGPRSDSSRHQLRGDDWV